MSKSQSKFRDREPGQGLVFLILDAGGIRGTSQLEILGEIVHQYNVKVHGHDEEKYKRPCKIFDAIVGSGSAGLIAILLVVFGMTVTEASANFTKISEEMFSDPAITPKERNEKLKNHIQQLLVEHNIPSQSTLLDTNQYSNECKLFVPIIARASASQSTYLHNYTTRSQPAIPMTIVEACVATLSKPSHFEPVLFRHHGATYEYISGDPNFPNPTREWIADAYGLDKEAGISCILSIGCGESEVIRVPDRFESIEWKYYQERALGDGERTAQEMTLQLGHLGLYYRLSAVDNFDIGDKANNVLSQIRTNARTYLIDHKIKAKIQRCVESMELRLCTSTLEMIYRSGGGKFTAPGLPPLSNHFVLRKEPWDKMVRTIMGDEDAEVQGQRILVISGLGGCGKTQLAIRFAKVFGNQFKSVFFTDGSSESRYRVDIVRYVRALGIEHSQKSFDDALLFIADDSSDGERLLIIDNVDDPSMDIEPLLPQCDHGAIIITTRNHILGQLSPHGHLQLDSMSEDEAVETLTRSSVQSWPPVGQISPDMKKICSELGYLPIALVQAGSYMAQTATSPTSYLSKLKVSRTTVMKYPAMGQRDMKRYKSAYAAFDASYKALPDRVQKVLQLFGTFHWDQFPVEYIQRAAKSEFKGRSFDFGEEIAGDEPAVEFLTDLFLISGSWSIDQWDTILVTLQSYSFITLTLFSTIALASIHPVTHMWLNDLAYSVGNQDLLQAAGVRLLGCWDGEWHSSDQYLVPQVVHHISQGYVRRTADTAVLARLLGVGGEPHHSLAMWKQVKEKVDEKYDQKDPKSTLVMEWVAHSTTRDTPIEEGDSRREAS
ncbi:FabD/lysophospholipase-like protein [Serendipita vermifera]|nr:FabD/lysophospholipase-like protein [Serendipita vermifera]